MTLRLLVGLEMARQSWKGLRRMEGGSQRGGGQRVKIEEKLGIYKQKAASSTRVPAQHVCVGLL